MRILPIFKVSGAAEGVNEAWNRRKKGTSDRGEPRGLQGIPLLSSVLWSSLVVSG